MRVCCHSDFFGGFRGNGHGRHPRTMIPLGPFRHPEGPSGAQRIRLHIICLSYTHTVNRSKGPFFSVYRVPSQALPEFDIYRARGTGIPRPPQFLQPLNGTSQVRDRLSGAWNGSLQALDGPPVACNRPSMASNGPSLAFIGPLRPLVGLRGPPNWALAVQRRALHRKNISDLSRAL